MRRDFSASGNGDDAPRLVVLKVINLKPLKRGGPVVQITRVQAPIAGRGRAVRVGIDLVNRVI